jgi:hypothetical protein
MVVFRQVQGVCLSNNVLFQMKSSAQSIRIVQICPYPVLPTTAGGKVRIVKLARHLAYLGVNVTVVTPYHPRQTRELIQQEPFRILQVPYPFILSLLLTDRPLPYQYWTSFHPGLSVLLGRELFDVDIVQFEHVQFVRLGMRLASDKVIVYGSHNVEYDYAQAECRSAWAAKLVGNRIRRLEDRLVNRSSHIFTVSAGDSSRLAHLYGADLGVMTIAPNGIDGPKSRVLDDHRVIQRFPGMAAFALRGLYSGSDVVHNRKAVHFLLNQVASRRPDVGFVIHGSCGNTFSRKCRLPNVFFDPEMDHFNDYTALGFRGLNTVTIGAGSNLKLLHYLSYGMPVTSTPFGMRGFEDLEPYVTVCESGDVWASFDDAVKPSVPDDIMYKYEWASIAKTMLGAYRMLISS